MTHYLLKLKLITTGNNISTLVATSNNYASLILLLKTNFHVYIY